MDKKKIRISIITGETRQPLWIDPKDEHTIRDAGRMLNSKIAFFRNEYAGCGLSSETLLAMAALELAKDLQRIKETANLEVIDARLADMITDLQTFMDDQPEQT